MEANIPLYPRNRPLKNLISDWKAKYPSTTNLLVGTWNYGEGTPDTVELTQEQNALYEAFKNYWYFSNIGFDTDEEFVFRFNAVWNENVEKYVKLINTLNDIGFGGDRKTTKFTTDRKGFDTSTKSGTNVITDKKTGTEDIAKGVSTTSSQSTSNVGDKLARTTPNEKLSVEGSSTTTVSDSGSDTTTFDTQIERTEQPNLESKQTYNSQFDNNGVETREKLTPEDYDIVVKRNSLLRDFALCFENIFIGVIDL